MTSASLIVAGSLDDATQAMGEGARVVAGGTDLVVGARQGKAPLPERIVAIHRLSELRGTREADEVLTLGALVTHAELAAAPIVRSRLTALADASAIVGSHATRAVGTIGGNLMNASPAMETGGPLLCFGATVTLRSSQGARMLTIDELLAGPGRTTASPGELLERVEIPLAPAGSGSCYARLEYRRQMEIAVVGATAVLTLEDGVVTQARVAITALAPTIRRVPEAEEALTGTDAGPPAAEHAARAIARASLPISDVRASAEYRSAMAAVIGRRAIEAAVARARGQIVPIPASPELHGGLT
jgi:CO/xanthine dehydrogenase FAD-binding subunit